MRHISEDGWGGHYWCDGTKRGYYSIGSFYREGMEHLRGYMEQGEDELIQEGDYYEPPYYEPVPYASIRVEPIMKCWGKGKR
ncbi:hypothetical protein EDM55_20070 [Brevibacillus centrosporus]|nr:hypothetical protein EDM55_20070 [Brevibacillus centrosporus]